MGGFRILQDTKKCDESRQLHYEGCLQEVRVEPGDTLGARSISSTSEEGRNGGNDYTSGLLEKILHRDTVNHSKLMRLLSATIMDSRVLALIGKYLKSGVVIHGVIEETEEGCPQGGNLSPLLSNIMLNELENELDIELAKRGLNFCR